MELRRDAHLPFPDHWACRWIYHWVCDAWPVRRQTTVTFSANGRYQFILLGEQRHIVCEQLVQSPYVKLSGRDSNLGCKSDALTTSLRHTTYVRRRMVKNGACVCCVKISRNKRKRQPIGMLGRSSGNHDWLLANASACISCGFRLRNARNASDCVCMETGL